MRLYISYIHAFANVFLCIKNGDACEPINKINVQPSANRIVNDK